MPSSSRAVRHWVSVPAGPCGGWRPTVAGTLRIVPTAPAEAIGPLPSWISRSPEDLSPLSGPSSVSLHGAAGIDFLEQLHADVGSTGRGAGHRLELALFSATVRRSLSATVAL
jgi:hypothetical protein